MSTKTKSIEYAYPTSPFATKQGFGDTGCYFVAIYNNLNDHKPTEYKAFCTNREGALKVFNGIKLPINNFHSLKSIN